MKASRETLLLLRELEHELFRAACAADDAWEHVQKLSDDILKLVTQRYRERAHEFFLEVRDTRIALSLELQGQPRELTYETHEAPDGRPSSGGAVRVGVVAAEHTHCTRCGRLFDFVRPVAWVSSEGRFANCEPCANELGHLPSLSLGGRS